MAPSNYVRDVPLPPPFLSEYASDASVRMASLRDSIREVEAVLAPAGGDTPPPSGPTQLIAAALTTQGEQFIRLSGGKIAPLHDLVGDPLSCMVSYPPTA